MNAIEELLRGHIRGCREAIVEATARADALEDLCKRLFNVPPPHVRVVHESTWLDEEEDFLREHYPNAGPTECARMMPHRSEVAIRSHAYRMGLSTKVKIWCGQCETRVASQQIASCKSKFCPEKVTRA